jgi:hypothetical protein
MDASLGKLDWEHNNAYTRYYFNLTFSGELFPGDVLLQSVGMTSGDAWFNLNRRNTRVQKAISHQKVTRFITNRKPM